MDAPGISIITLIAQIVFDIWNVYFRRPSSLSLEPYTFDLEHSDHDLEKNYVCEILLGQG